MKTLYTYLLAALAIILAGCHHIDDYSNDNMGSFQALWNEIDRHYCFFNEKDVDWNEVYTRYAPLVSNKMSREDFFALMAKMIDELRDGHTNLSSPFATSYYRAWWSDYPQNYDGRLIEQYYFNFNYRQIGSFTYEILPQNIGYVRVPTFESGLGAGNIDYIISYFSKCTGLIIDVRDNGGGNLTNVEDLVNRFISKRTLAGYIIHKTGPGHNDFDEPFAYYFNPAGPDHLGWTKPVVVLTNRSTFSAANNFVSIMKLLPQVTVIGDTTGGGSGMPYSSELPNGWGIRFSACSILDAEGHTTEFGVEPTEGFNIDMNPEDALQGHDTILDAAINYLI
ncbi:MAG: S41 family peptidase [Paramuribaculum sp.]|nr:S41 family peptidase [Paramuribaculum sp.]